MCLFQKAPHKVDNSFFTRWQEGPSLVEARSAHTSFVTSQVGRWSSHKSQASSQVRWGGDLVRGSNYVHALILIVHLRNWCWVNVEAPLALNNDHLLPTPRLDTSFVSYLHYIHQGILLVGGGDSPGTAELVRYNQAMMIEYCKKNLWSKKLRRSTYSILKALFIKRDQCQPWWYIVNLDAKNDCGQWPSQFPLCLLCFHL